MPEGIPFPELYFAYNQINPWITSSSPVQKWLVILFLFSIVSEMEYVNQTEMGLYGIYISEVTIYEQCHDVGGKGMPKKREKSNQDQF
jgi:hypothetical protein